MNSLIMYISNTFKPILKKVETLDNSTKFIFWFILLPPIGNSYVRTHHSTHMFSISMNSLIMYISNTFKPILKKVETLDNSTKFIFWFILLPPIGNSYVRTHNSPHIYSISMNSLIMCISNTFRSILKKGEALDNSTKFIFWFIILPPIRNSYVQTHHSTHIFSISMNSLIMCISNTFKPILKKVEALDNSTKFIFWFILLPPIRNSYVRTHHSTHIFLISENFLIKTMLSE